MPPAVEVWSVNHWIARDVPKLPFFFFGLRWVFIATCGLFSSCGERGLLFLVVRGLFVAVASFVVEHGL